MRRFRHTLSGVAASLVLAMAASAAEPRIGKFKRYDTGDFVIVTSRSGAQAREIIQKLVKFRLTLEKALGKRASRSGIDTHIIITGSDDWDKYLRPGERIAGFFQRTQFDNYLALDGDAGEYAIHVMFHEYTHFHLSSHFAGEYPPWFNEGLAELMAYAKFKKNTVLLQIPVFRVHEARDRDWLPFDRLIAVTHDSPEYQSHKLAESFYAQSWLTVHYGMIEDREFGRQIVQYINERNKLVPHDDAARGAFGADLSAVDSKLRAYARRQNMNSGGMELGAVPEITLPEAEPLSDADALAALIDVMLTTRLAPDRIRPLIEALLRREPESARSHVLAARLAFVQYKSPEMDAALERAVKALRPEDAAQRRELGNLLLARAHDPDPMNVRSDDERKQDLERAVTLLEESVQRNGEDAKALWGLGTALTQLQSDLETAELVLRAAYERVPASGSIAVSLASLKGRQDKPEEMVPYLRDAVRIAPDLGTRRWALNTLEQIEQFVRDRNRAIEENRLQQEAYEKQLAEYEKKYGKRKKK